MRSLFLLISLLMISSCNTKVDSSNNTLPNIVIVLTDDQGYQDLGSFGSPNILTPNLDKVSKEGARLLSFYSAQAVCSASRAALLTGSYPNRIGISGALSPKSTVGINKNETTIAEMLKPLGYKTGIFGKWHLGHQQEFLPNNHGFDEFIGIPYSNDMWPVDYDGKQVPADHNLAKRYPRLPFFKNFDVIKEIRTLEGQAQLTTELFGFFAPTRPDIAVKLANLAVRTTARENAAWIAEFNIIMYALASKTTSHITLKDKTMWMSKEARKHLPNTT